MGSSSSLTQLEMLLTGGNRGGEPEVRLALSKLASELKSRAHQGGNSSVTHDYFATALHVVSRIRGLSNPELRLASLHDCFMFFFVNGESRLAIETAQRMKELAERADMPYFITKAYTALGAVHAEEHRIGEAVLNYSKALELARSIADACCQTAAWINLGSALNYGSLYRDAIPCFVMGKETAANSSDARHLEASALCNLAQSHYFLDEHDQAYRWILECIRHSVEPTCAAESFNRTVRELTFVRIAIALGRRKEALEHVDACSAFASHFNSSKSGFLAELAKGIFEVHFGNVQRGLSILEKSASSSLTDIGILKDDALAALILAYDQVGQPEKALGCLRELTTRMMESRKMGLLALSSLGVSSGTGGSRLAHGNDLHSFSLMEARLRARIAERDAEEVKLEMLERLAVAADLKEDISGQHGYRVGGLAAEISKALNWRPAHIAELEAAARLHDIGKTAVPDRILLSPEALPGAQRQFLVAHTTVGGEMLCGSSLGQIRLAEQVARHHHEWWNGEGYPARLAGKRIPIHARIVALADVFDALTHGRPFSPPWPVEKALAEIRSRRGTQFDPELTDIFLNLMDRLIAEHEDLDAYLGRASRHSPFLQARNKIRRMLETERENEKLATAAGSQTRH